MSFLHLYQILHGNKPHDRGFIPVYNSKTTILYENEVILALLNNNIHKKSKYFGITSKRITEKTGYTYKKLKKKIKDKNVYIYSKNGNPQSLFQNRGTFIGKIMRRLVKLGVIRNQDWKLVMCNYWICDTDTAEQYRVFLNKIHGTFYTDKILNKMINGDSFPHRGKLYPLHPFVYEYFFGLFLAENKQLTIEYL